MKKMLLILAISLSALGIFGSTAQGGLFVTVDVLENGVGVDAWYGSTVLDTPATVIVTVGGVEFTTLVTPSESPLASQLITADTTVRLVGSPGTAAAGTVLVRALYTDVDLPVGDPVLLVSGVNSLAPSPSKLVLASNLSFVDEIAVGGLPPALGSGFGPAPFSFSNPGAGGLLASISGPTGLLTSLDDTQMDLRPRPFPGIPPGSFDVLSDIRIDFTGLSPTGAMNVTTSTVVLSAVPEASSIIGWTLCAALGLFVAHRRKRAT